MFNIFSGQTSTGQIDSLLWKVTYRELNKAVDSVFIDVSFGDPNWEFINSLKKENGIFSAFKNHKQSNELRALLHDGKGQIKQFSSFKKDTEKVIGKYNKQWLKTEHSTAVLSSRSAYRFRKYKETLHLYSNVMYTPSRSASPRQIHKAFYYVVLPYDHPWWNNHLAPLDWNCKCGHKNTDEEITEIPDDKDVFVAPGLDNNPARSKKLFSDSHPYVAKTKKKDIKGIMKQATSLLRKSSSLYAREWGKLNIKHKHKGIIYKSENIPGGKLCLRQSDINSITGKPHKHYYHRNLMVTELDKVFEQATYLETRPDKGRHPNVLDWHYYEIELMGDKSYISVMFTKQNEYRIHSISDSFR